MNSIRKWHRKKEERGRGARSEKPIEPKWGGGGSRYSLLTTRYSALAVALVVSIAAWFAFGDGASAFIGAQADAQTAAQAQASDPEANLPYLFAVYIITWAAFFAYVFYVSRRQREMQAEIDALKRALEDKSSA